MAPLGRTPMCFVMSVQNLFIYGVRYGYPLFVPFICSEFRYSDAQRAQLLAAFTPGYIVTQIPGGLWAGRVGGKVVLTWISYAMIGLLLALPWAAGRSLNLARLALLGIGLAQAPLRPAQQLMTYNWVPFGPSRAYQLMVISLGSALAKTAAAIAIPALCAGRGWRSAIVILAGTFGGFNVLWQVLGTEFPAPLATVVGATAEVEKPRHQKLGEETEKLGRLEKEKADAAAPSIREMFFAPPFQAIIWSHTMKDLIDVHTFGLWAPSFLHLRHAVPLGRVGAYLLWPGLCAVGGKIANAAFESRLTRSGISILAIRKLSTLVATAGQLLFSALFVAAPTAKLATISYCAMTLTGTWHYSGLEPNYLVRLCHGSVMPLLSIYTLKS
jgi:ACS family sodium-dependent inorganic phosphate cotransporter